MKKFLAFIFIVITACILSGLYGILHDQITYTISPEYYTRFKFYQFGLLDKGNEGTFANPRLQVSLVGFLASFWMGIPIGIFLGLTGLFHSGWRRMMKITMNAFAITVVITFLTGILGLAYGHFYLAGKTPAALQGWFIPDNLIDFKSFIKAGSMHNFSYLGAAVGLTIGIMYSFWQRIKLRKLANRIEGSIGSVPQ